MRAPHPCPHGSLRAGELRVGAHDQVLIDVVEAVQKAVAYEGSLEVTEVCRAAEQMEFLKLRTLHG